MTGALITSLVSLLVAVLVGWAVPAWAIRRLLPVLEDSGHLVTNYRNRRIPTGLGLVWLVWAVGVALASTALSYIGSLTGNSITTLHSMPALLVVGALTFGLVDDVLGNADAKGFRGHLRAMFEGRLTTGGLKLLGIGILSLVFGTRTVGVASATGPGSAFVAWVFASLVIALSANLVNLMDLRPGRAIKAYGALALTGVIVLVADLWSALPIAQALSYPVVLGFVDAKLVGLCLAVLLLGPVAAVWRYDLGERAMLGDAGANAMGALAGYFLVWHSPLWLTAVFAVLLLMLNLASEKVSFSKVIERVRVLRWIDGLGRLPAGSPSHTVSVKVDDDARKDGGTSNQ